MTLTVLFGLIIWFTPAIFFFIALEQRNRLSKRVKELESQLREKPKRKRKNDEIDTRYRWVIAPTRIKIEDIPVHQWKDDDERRKAMALMRETTVSEERPKPFATTRIKK